MNQIYIVQFKTSGVCHCVAFNSLSEALSYKNKCLIKMEAKISAIVIAGMFEDFPDPENFANIMFNRIN